MKVLLHACCGPCLIEPLDALVAQHEVAVVYANPNIHPRTEYELRRDTLLAYARDISLPVTELPYDPVRWITSVERFADDPQRRCDACWSLRLSMSAVLAAEQGFDAIATTLTVSPYQDPQGVREAGTRAAGEAGIVYLDHDFRELYPRATIRSRAAGMYRQNYCGCLFSKTEAEAQRLARREARKAELGR